ncbi:MAG: hypothetical protein GY953_01370, partial [bacterium]|nr:hypothetical protein [bacterium]
MASGTNKLGGTGLLYRSQDLRRWEYLHPLLEGEGRRDTVWEVPGLFRLDGKVVLLYSPTKESTYTRYFIGEFRDQQFHAEGRGKLDLGAYYYAATTFEGPARRRIAIAWLKEGRSKDATVRAGWAGCLSLPRVLSLSADGRVVSEPVAEVKKLRRERRRLERRDVTGDLAVPGVEGKALEIIAEFEQDDAESFGVKVLCSPEGDEQTTVGYDAVKRQFFVDATQASQNPDAHNKRTGGALTL